MTPQDNTNQPEPPAETPPVQQQAIPPQISLEAAQRQHSMPGIPKWQPEEGDNN
jgi:hypothetical protein